MLFWISNNFFDVYIYANNTIVTQMPLLSGLTGAEGGFHDWNYLLAKMNLINKLILWLELLGF